MHISQRICEAPVSYCPKCGQNALEPHLDNAFQCNSCGFMYFHNVAATTVVVIAVETEILLAVRARDPQKGFLDLPGGFVSHGETSEQALQRELQEELSLTINPEELIFLGSVANQYPYQDVIYHTVDAIYGLGLSEKPHIDVSDDVADVMWCNPDTLDRNKMCFSAMYRAVQLYRHHRDRPST